MTASVALNILNPEAIETFVRELLWCLPREEIEAYESWAVIALKPAICCSPALFEPVTKLPDNCPDWLTSEKMARGTFHRFAPGATQDCASQLGRIRWLADWFNLALLGNARVPTQVLPPSWFRGLRHIRSLDDAIARARRDLEIWSYADCRGVAKRRSAKAFVARKALVRRCAHRDGKHQWYELMKPEALIAEARILSNCLHRPSYRIELARGTARFFSLRTSDLMPQLAVRVPRVGCWQAFRRFNQRPDAAELLSVSELVASMVTWNAVSAIPARDYTEDQIEVERLSSFAAVAGDFLRCDEELSAWSSETTSS